jgi:hypothetical protein
MFGPDREERKEESEAWGPKQWQEAKQDNQQRYLSEDQRNASSLNFIDKAAQNIWEGIVHIYNYITGNTPFNAAKDMLDPSYPDRRREAVVYLSKREYGRRDPYAKYFAEMAHVDDDATVRAMAIRALNRCRYKASIPVYIQALEDASPLVRLEAAKALANMPDPGAIDALIKHLKGNIQVRVKDNLEPQEETGDVRVACADALRCYGSGDVTEALASVLRDRNFAVSWQARKSLKLITGQDYRYDDSAWLTYLSGRM